MIADMLVECIEKCDILVIGAGIADINSAIESGLRQTSFNRTLSKPQYTATCDKGIRMNKEERITRTSADQIEDAAEVSLRPQVLEEYIGQKNVTDNLKIFIEAAK